MRLPPLSDEDRQFIDELARKSGTMALEMRKGVAVHHKSGPHDLVTDADLTISKMLIESLQKRFPDDLIVSEEDKHPLDAGNLQTPAQRRIWLIDPIDGTENYVKNDGQYTTMIGLLVDGQPHFGWIYQPSASTMFYGSRELGAWRQQGDRAPVRYQPSKRLDEDENIRLMMGWGDRRRHPWVMELPGVCFVPSDSLGLKIMKILDGGADLFLSLTGKVKLWDTAAPAAIALGADLDVGTAEGEPLPYPVPRVQHGSSVIIGRPGSINWARQNVVNHHTQTNSSR